MRTSRSWALLLVLTIPIGLAVLVCQRILDPMDPEVAR